MTQEDLNVYAFRALRNVLRREFSIAEVEHVAGRVRLWVRAGAPYDSVARIDFVIASGDVRFRSLSDAMHNKVKQCIALSAFPLKRTPAVAA